MFSICYLRSHSGRSYLLIICKEFSCLPFTTGSKNSFLNHVAYIYSVCSMTVSVYGNIVYFHSSSIDGHHCPSTTFIVFINLIWPIKIFQSNFLPLTQTSDRRMMWFISQHQELTFKMLTTYQLLNNSTQTAVHQKYPMSDPTLNSHDSRL